jgi:hypothetical protein
MGPKFTDLSKQIKEQKEHYADVNSERLGGQEKQLYDKIKVELRSNKQMK